MEVRIVLRRRRYGRSLLNRNIYIFLSFTKTLFLHSSVSTPMEKNPRHIIIYSCGLTREQSIVFTGSFHDHHQRNCLSFVSPFSIYLRVFLGKIRSSVHRAICRFKNAVFGFLIPLDHKLCVIERNNREQ